MTERITAAAILLADGKVHSKPPPARHPSLIYDVQAEEPQRIIGHVQGFVTSTGRIVKRSEAYRIAVEARQLLYDLDNSPLGWTPTPGTLYSEDVW